MNNIDYNDLSSLIKKVKELHEGIDPYTKLKFPEDTILNSSANKKIFNSISEILNKVIVSHKCKQKKDMRFKEHFYITDKQINLFRLSKTPVSISMFTHSINNHVHSPSMKKLKATEITSWLVANGYLNNVEQDNGEFFKVPSEKSENIGIVLEEKESEYGKKYKVNLYSLEAQKFILSHLNEITKES